MKKDPFRQLCRLAGKAVGDYSMINEGDSILLGVSGGEDSLVLLEVLKYFQSRAPISFSLETVTFDPGFEGFDAKATAAFCRSKGVKHHTVKLNIPALLNEKHAEERPCVLCSRMRRGKLYSAARRFKCGKLALAQHLDDILASFMISLTRGGGLTAMGPNVSSDSGDIRVIRPFAYAEKRLIHETALALGLPVHGKCLYHEGLERSGDRAFYNNLMDTLAKRIPDIRRNMLHSLSDVRPPYLLDKRFIEL